MPLTPSDTWGGAGLLGVTIRLDDYAGAEDRLVRVLTVEPNSPAEIAGLQPETDFLLGTTHQTLDSVDRLAVAVLQPNIDRVVELYVYNTETDLVRVVALMPTYKWGGGGGRRGLLGAEVGVGYLHRLPFKTRDTSGSSVERKVRYVNVENSTENRDNENNNSHTIQTPSSSTSSRRQLQPQLELEPQLEMEPGSDDDDDDEVESVALTPVSTPVKPTHEQKAPPVVEDRKMAAAAAEPTYEQSQQQQQRKAPPVAAAAPENTQTPTPNDYQRPQPAPNSAEALFKQPHRTYSSGSPQNNINQYQQQPPQQPQRTFSNTSSPNYYQQHQQQQQQAYEHSPPQPQHQQNPYSAAAAAAAPPQRQSSYSAPPPAPLSNGSPHSYTSPQPQSYGQVAAAVPTYQQKSSPQYAMQQNNKRVVSQTLTRWQPRPLSWGHSRPTAAAPVTVWLRLRKCRITEEERRLRTRRVRAVHPTVVVVAARRYRRRPCGIRSSISSIRTAERRRIRHRRLRERNEKSK